MKCLNHAETFIIHSVHCSLGKFCTEMGIETQSDQPRKFCISKYESLAAQMGVSLTVCSLQDPCRQPTEMYLNHNVLTLFLEKKTHLKHQKLQLPNCELRNEKQMIFSSNSLLLHPYQNRLLTNAVEAASKGKIITFRSSISLCSRSMTEQILGATTAHFHFYNRIQLNPEQS